MAVTSESGAGFAVKLTRTSSSQDFQSSIRPPTSKNCELDVSNFLIIHKKRLDLPENRGTNVAETGNFREEQRLLCHSNKPGVLFLFLLLFLLSFQNAD